MSKRLTFTTLEFAAVAVVKKVQKKRGARRPKLRSPQLRERGGRSRIEVGEGDGSTGPPSPPLRVFVDLLDSVEKHSAERDDADDQESGYALECGHAASVDCGKGRAMCSGHSTPSGQLFENQASAALNRFNVMSAVPAIASILRASAKTWAETVVRRMFLAAAYRSASVTNWDASWIMSRMIYNFTPLATIFLTVAAKCWNI